MPDAQRFINTIVSDVDRYTVTYDVPAPLPRPRLEPLNWDELMQRVMKVTLRNERLYRWKWKYANMRPSMSRVEAQVWLALIGDSNAWRDMQQKHYSGEMSHAELKMLLENRRGYLPPGFICALWVLFPVADFFPLLLSNNLYAMNLSRHWHQEIHQYTTQAELVTMREAVAAHLPKVGQRNRRLTGNNPYNMNVWIYRWAAYLGMHDAIRDGLRHMDTPEFRREFRYKQSRNFQDVVFGLGSENEVVTTMKRLGLYLAAAEQGRLWVAHTGLRQLSYIKESILHINNQRIQRDLIKVLAEVKRPAVGGYMLELLQGTQVRNEAWGWLNDHPELAVEGVYPHLRGRGRLAESAHNFVRHLMRHGHQALLASVLDDTTMMRLTEDVTATTLPLMEEGQYPGVLQEALAALAESTVKPPAWVKPSDLPPIVMGGHRLPEDAVTALLIDLRQRRAGENSILVRFVREYADRKLLDDWCWQLLQHWQIRGGKVQDLWALRVPGYFGTDALLLQFVELLKDWIKARKKRYMDAALQSLIVAGRESDAAVLQLFALQPLLQPKRRGHLVDEALSIIAAYRELSVEDLGDIAVPDCGLDATGSRGFDYGAREFTLTISGELTPLLRDDKGKLRKNLPRAGKRDDRYKVEEAKRDWKQLKKQLKDTIKVQSRRMEQAMIGERRWTWTRFETVFLAHPFLRHLAKQFVWGVYDEAGQCRQTFRAGDDLQLYDIEDNVLAAVLKADDTLCVGIVHPLHIVAEERVQWGQLFQDYEIIPLFPQMGRELFGLPDDFDKAATNLNAMIDTTVSAMKIRKLMNEQGWERHPQNFYFRYYPRYDVTTVAIFSYRREDNPVNVSRFKQVHRPNSVFCYPGVLRAASQTSFHRYSNDGHPGLPLSEITPLIISETLRALTTGLHG